MAVVTNDIYSQEDALILARAQDISDERIIGVFFGATRIAEIGITAAP